MSTQQGSFLAIDFGNTRKKLAIFNSAGQICQRIFLSQQDWKNEILILLEKQPVKKIALSTVIPVEQEFLNKLNMYGEFIQVGKTSIPSELQLPKAFLGRMGADRIGLALGAIKTMKHRNHLVISLGTCITYNFINSHNYFLGGSISAGLEMRLKAMHQFTAQLPLYTHLDIDLSRLCLVGYDTHSHIVSGLINTITKELEGMIESYNQSYPELCCTISGGDSELFAQLYNNQIFHPQNIIPKFDPDLLFRGLFHFYGV